MKPKVKKILGRTIGALFGVAVVGLIVVASLPKPIPVDAAAAANGVLEVTIDEDGRTRVKDRYTISAPLNGNLGRVELRAGDEVEEGEVLARIVPLHAPLMDPRTRAQSEARLAQALAAQRQTRASVTRAESAAEYAASELRRSEQMADRGVTSPQALERARYESRSRSEELASARFGVRVADHEVRMARAALGRLDDEDDGEQMEVPAPVAGRVLRMIREDEGVVSAGTPLLEIGDPAALEVVVDVLTADAVKIEPGAHVTLERWGGEHSLEGHVRSVEPSAFTQTSSLGVQEQRVNVVIDIDSPREEWEALGDGFRIEARIRVWREEDALVIPASALFRSDDGWGVFVVDGEVAHRRSVEVGRRNGIEAQITGGLAAGDEVIVHPSDQISDGVEVRVR